jgi:RHS repeat-associated protein
MAIHPVTGGVSLEPDDIVVPGRVELRWTARYTTAHLDQPTSPVGRGWHGIAFCTLRPEAQGFVFVTERGAEEHIPDPDGRVLQGGLARVEGAYLELFRHGDRYVVRTWDAESGALADFCFTPVDGHPWPLTAIEDVSGDGIDLSWLEHAATLRLVTLRQRTEGRELKVDYDRAGWLAGLSLIGADGSRQQLVGYEHDESGHLLAIVDAAGFADRFEYDSAGRVTREVMRDGGVFHYRYDDEQRCVLHTGLSHYNERRFRYLPAIRVTEVTDSLGAVTTYFYSAEGQIVQQVDGLGGRRTTEYDHHGRMTASTDATGARTAFQFDAHGNRSRVIDPMGRTTTVTFNTRHQPVEMVDPMGAKWTREYDAQGRLARTVDPLGNRWTYLHDAAGNLVELRNPLSLSRRMAYSGGLLVAATDWMGHTTTFEYDGAGRETARHAPGGQTWRYRYDPMGNLTEVHLPDGTAAYGAYDRGGNLVRHVDPKGRVTSWLYGPCGRMLQQTDPAGGVLRYVWGSEAELLEEIRNQKGEAYVFEHDELGRVVAETTFDGARRTFRLDAEGRTMQYTNASGQSLEFTRDASGLVTAQRLDDGDELVFEYDARRDFVLAARGAAQVAYERDPLGRVLKEVQGSRWAASHYDAAGGLTRLSTSEELDVRYALDGNGLVTGIATADAAMAIERNADGLVTERQLSRGARLSNRYDAMGRLSLQRLVPAGAFDGAANPVVQRQYEYDPAGLVQHITDLQRGDKQYAHDGADRLVSTLRSRGTSEVFDYDATGNIIRLRAEGRSVRDETLQYGPGDRLLSQGHTLFEYDGEGRCVRRLEMADGPSPQVWIYQWNVLDQLTTLTRPDGQIWRYRYDALGRRIAKLCDGAVVAEFLWDREVIAQELPAAGPRRSWLWNPDSFAPLGTVQHGKLYSVVNDQIDTPLEIVDEHGYIAWARDGDSWGRTEALERPQSSPAPVCDIRFPGQWADAESGLHYNFFRSYDPTNGRYIGNDPIGIDGDTNAYRYVPSPLTWIDPLGLCSGNSGRARRAQHGYVIIDNKTGKIVKVGISGQPLNSNGSPRANNQVNRWNRQPGGKYLNPNTGKMEDRYRPEVRKKIPAGPNARQKALTWEQNTVDRHQSTLDPDRHKRPQPTSTK